jgi:hypothetical protein
MRRRLGIWAALFVGVGAVYALAGWNRDTALWLLITGLVFAVAVLLTDRHSRR